jgi:hypothetical protein
MIEQDTVNTEQAKHDKPTGSTSVTGDRLAEAKRSHGADGLAGGHLGNIIGASGYAIPRPRTTTSEEGMEERPRALVRESDAAHL